MFFLLRMKIAAPRKILCLTVTEKTNAMIKFMRLRKPIHAKRDALVARIETVAPAGYDEIEAPNYIEELSPDRLTACRNFVIKSAAIPWPGKA
jgi:hypothetical protein